MASRPILVIVIGLIVVLIVSWALGEALRQRKNSRRRPKR